MPARIQAFASQIAATSTASLGCLPLVTFDLRKPAPWVSELGVRLADDVAKQVTAAGLTSTVLGTNGMAIRLTELNVDRVSLHSLASVSDHGDRLGVDTIVFGTIKRDENLGRDGLDQLSIDLTAFDLFGRNIVATEKFALRSDQLETRDHWLWAERSSTWQPGDKFPVPEPERSLDREIHAVTRVLAKRVLAAIGTSDIQGIVYIPPTDTARFVRSIARLRGVQSVFAAEFTARMRDAERNGTPLDVARPMRLDNIDFNGLQAAKAYLETLRESLLATDTARFGMSVSSSLAQEVLAKLSTEVRVNDLGFTKWSDTQLVEGELATGGLARSLLARRAMRAMDIALVIAPRLERFGDHFQLRAKVYDLIGERLAATTYARLDRRFNAALRSELGVEYPLQRIVQLRTVEQESWDDVYQRVASGVVRLTGSNGVSGTGFVVRADGYIVTNAHVVRDIGNASPSVVLADGTAGPFEVVARNDFWDVAIVRVAGLPSGVHVFELADASRIEVGAEVAVLGHPTGSRGWIITPGNLSALGETVPSVNGDRPSYMYTARTTDGTSGSPVLGLDGRVVAVDSRELTAAYVPGGGIASLAGFSFGAPAPEVRRILLERGVLSR